QRPLALEDELQVRDGSLRCAALGLRFGQRFLRLAHVESIPRLCRHSPARDDVCVSSRGCWTILSHLATLLLARGVLWAGAMGACRCAGGPMPRALRESEARRSRATAGTSAEEKGSRTEKRTQ